MKKRSSKWAAVCLEWNPKRRAFLEEHLYCAECGGCATDCHEILAGAHRNKAFVERACWLRLCRRCHNKLQGTDLIYQLALKLLSDPSGFDLVKFHEVWGRPTTAITPAEVLEQIKRTLIHHNAA